MSKNKAATIRYWLVLCLAGFSLGTIMGGVAQRNWQTALTTGAIGVPAICVSALLINSGRQSTRAQKLVQTKRSSRRPSYSQPSLPRTSSQKISPSHSSPEQPYQHSPLQQPRPKQPYPPAVSSDLTHATLNTPLSPSAFVTAQVAIFWDYENVQVSVSAQMTQLAHAIDEMAQAKGHCLKKYVYSNWGQESLKAAPPLTSHGFNAIHVAMGKPNSVDVRLAVDCISAAYEHPDIKHFVLVTSDKDYISLVNKLQELRREVILIGGDRTSPIMRESATQFISISALLKPNPENGSSHPPKIPSIPPSRLSFEQGAKCLLTVLSHLSQKISDNAASHIISLSQLDNLMRKESAFTYKGCTSICQPGSTKAFSKFSHFIETVESQGLVTTYQHHSRTHIALVPLLTFDEAMNCVVYALFLDHTTTKAETYQDVNITYLHRLVSQHLGLQGFTPTKMLLLRKDGGGRYASLSKFLKDVCNMGAIALNRDEGKVYITLTQTPKDTNPPMALMTRLAQLQANIPIKANAVPPTFQTPS